MTDEPTTQVYERETSWEIWNSPDSLADYLYELRYRLEQKKAITRATSKDDYLPLYKQLKLSNILPYKQFCEMAKGEADPSPALLDAIYDYLCERHNKSTIDVYLAVASDYATYRLPSLLQEKLASEAALYRAAQDLGIYSSMLRALMTGDLVASPPLLKKLCRYFAFDAAAAAEIGASGQRYLTHIERQSPQRAFLMRLFAQTDRATSLPLFMQDVLREESLFQSKHIIKASGGDGTALDTVVGDIYRKGKKPNSYDKPIIQQLAKGLSLHEPLAALLEEMGTHRPFGTLLEEYMQTGGKNWNGVLNSLIQDSGETTIRFYNELKLSKILSYEQFSQVAQGDAEPPYALLVALHHYVNEQYKRPAAKDYAAAVKGCLKPGEVLSLHPYCLTALLQERLEESDAARYRVAQDLGIYPSMLSALMDGELVASAPLLKKICSYFSFDAATAAEVERSGQAYLARIEQESPRRAFVMQHLAQTDRTTSLAWFMQGLLKEGSPVQSEQIVVACGGDSTALDSVMADMRGKGIILMRRNYDEKAVKRLVKGLALTKPLTALFEEMGTCRPFGTLLEEYVLAGGRSWSGFLDSVMQDWGQGVVPFSRGVGLDVQAVIGWIGNDSSREMPSRPNRKTLERLAENVGLNPKQHDYLFALALGDLSQGAEVSTIVREAQAQMKQIKGLHDRELYGSLVLDRLLKRGGHTASGLGKLDGVGPAIITRQRSLGSKDAEFDYSHPLWVRSAHIVARAICPDNRSRIAPEIAMLFQGIPEMLSPSQMLEEVLAGQRTAGEMVKQYRLQEQLPALDMIERLGFVRATQDYTVCEQAPHGGTPSLGLIAALTREMKLNDEQRQIFARAMRGNLHQESQILTMLDKAVAGQASFSDVLKQILKEKYQPKMAAGNIGLGPLAADLGVAHSDTARWYKGQRHIRLRPLAEKLATIANIPPERLEDFITVAQDKIPTYDPSLMEAWQDAPDAQQRYDLFQSLRENARLSNDECAERIGTNGSSLRRSFLNQDCSWNLKASLEALAELLIPSGYPEHRRKFCEWFGPPKQVETSHVERLAYEAATNRQGASRTS